MPKTLVTESYKKQWEDIQKQRILDAAMQVLKSRGSQRLTVENVAQAAGIAKGSIYYYFRNKQDLLKMLKESALQPLREQIDLLFEQDLPPLETLIRMFATQFHYFEEKRDFFRVLLFDRQDPSARWNRINDQRYRFLMAKIAAVIDKGISEGLFRDVDSMKIANMLFESAIALLRQRFDTDSPVPIEQDVDLIVSTFIRGIAAK